MSTDFPHVEISTELHAIFGEPIPDTRIYRKQGAQEEISFWYDEIETRFGGAVSPGGVSMFAPVSRAAVHKRIKEGKLTCFLFDITHRKRNLFGTTKEVRELGVSMIPVSECKAWGREIQERAIKQGIVTREELEGDKPDWHGEFLEANSSWEKKKTKSKGSAKK